MCIITGTINFSGFDVGQVPVGLYFKWLEHDQAWLTSICPYICSSVIPNGMGEYDGDDDIKLFKKITK